jgi:hypothetical protein
MTVHTAHVYLYAATAGDYEKALAAAQACGVPRQNVIGNYSKTWTLIASGQDLVIAVGGAALNALYYNPCGWSNPKGMDGGHTPFEAFAAGHGVERTEANFFVNAAGCTALDSLKLAVMLTYYAIHGTFPYQYRDLPQQEVPQHLCVAGSTPNIAVSDPVSISTPSASNGVGVYATFSSKADAMRAIRLGWNGLGATAALGTKTSPYTAVLPAHPDRNIAEALAETNADVFCLSFWTVSWPAASDSFYNAGHQAGRYAANYFGELQAKYIPNYVILDPEGYNRPAETPQEWRDFIEGWANGIQGGHRPLKPAFYCNQSQYETYELSSIPFPAFVAIAPILGNQPYVKGNNIEGYIAYYARCPVRDEIAQVKRWGARYNTVQFLDCGVDCGPS